MLKLVIITIEVIIIESDLKPYSAVRYVLVFKAGTVIVRHERLIL